MATPRRLLHSLRINAVYSLVCCIFVAFSELSYMEFRVKTDIANWDYRLRHSDKLLVMGSCFAEHIGGRLEQMKFRTVVNPYGVLYNPLSIAGGLKRLIEQHLFTEEELHEFPDGGWNTWLHHSRYSHPDKQTALTVINNNLKVAACQLAEADVLIITLGTAWVYRLEETGEIVGNCHKIPERKFVRQRLQVQEIVEALTEILRRTCEINPKLRVLFTVSPVRHLKDGLHGNLLSKATLLLAIDELCRIFPKQCYYFPAYEIVMDELRDYRFYTEDMAHPSKQAIDYVWGRFIEHCFDNETRLFMQQWEKIVRALEHRPFQPDSIQYQQFVRQYLEKIIELQEHYPYIEIEKEVAQCHSLLKNV